MLSSACWPTRRSSCAAACAVSPFAPSGRAAAVTMLGAGGELAVSTGPGVWCARLRSSLRTATTAFAGGAGAAGLQRQLQHVGLAGLLGAAFTLGGVEGAGGVDLAFEPAVERLPLGCGPRHRVGFPTPLDMRSGASAQGALFGGEHPCLRSAPFWGSVWRRFPRDGRLPVPSRRPRTPAARAAGPPDCSGAAN